MSSRKIIIAIVAIVVVLLVAFLTKTKSESLTVLHGESTGVDYYNNLLAQCENEDEGSCCAISVSSMIAGEYELAGDNKQCPEGLSVNTLKCPGSYTWCQ